MEPFQYSICLSNNQWNHSNILPNNFFNIPYISLILLHLPLEQSSILTNDDFRGQKLESDVEKYGKNVYCFEYHGSHILNFLSFSVCSLHSFSVHCSQSVVWYSWGLLTMCWTSAGVTSYYCPPLPPSPSSWSTLSMEVQPPLSSHILCDSYWDTHWMSVSNLIL